MDFLVERNSRDKSSPKSSFYRAGAQAPDGQVACLSFRILEPRFVQVAQVPTEGPAIPCRTLCTPGAISSCSSSFPLKEKWANKSEQSHPDGKPRKNFVQGKSWIFRE
jgi:hypothetical protein